MKARAMNIGCLIIVGLFYALRLSTMCIASEDSYAEALKEIELKVEDLKTKLGPNAGIPEVADTYTKVPHSARILTSAEVEKAFSPIYSQIHKEEKNWQIGIDPRELKYPLRAEASILAALVTAIRSQFGDENLSIKLAHDISQFLIWTQTQARTGVYPFPMTNEGKGAAFNAVNHFLSEAKKQGNLKEVINNNWLCADFSDGGLQFDNAEVGIAMFQLYELTQDKAYLISATQAADWAAHHIIVRNWNYNAFSIGLLAKAYSVTHNPIYLYEAIHKAMLGVIPGQLTTGPERGRWLDQHNARPAYHYIMMQALCELIEVMPVSNPAHSAIIDCIKIGLINRNEDFLTKGAPTKEKAFTALIAAKRVFKNDPQFLKDTHTLEALHNLELIISSQYLHGSFPLSPREWALFLAEVKQGSD